MYACIYVCSFLRISIPSSYKIFPQLILFLSTANTISNQIIKDNTSSQEEKSLQLAHTELYLTGTFDFDTNVLKFVFHTNMEKVKFSILTNLLASQTCCFGFATHKVSLFPCFSFSDTRYVLFGYKLHSTALT